MLNSTFMIQAIVILVTVKIFISTSTHTFLSLLFQFLSILSFYLIFALLSYIESLYNVDSYNLAGMFPILLSWITTWFLLYFFMVGFILVDYGMMFIDTQV